MLNKYRLFQLAIFIKTPDKKNKAKNWGKNLVLLILKFSSDIATET